MKILILGGYGTFGGRLAYLLANDERVTLLIAGRSKQKAEAFCKKLPEGAERVAVFFDRNGNVEAQIRDINPNLVVDATGPFQSYGEDPYRVVKACIANGVDYMDLADGSDFVKNISQYDEQSKAKNIYVLSGVSSFPVLTAAVVRRLSQGLAQINTIKGGIAPSPYAGVGLNVIRAIATYSGKRLPLIRNKQPAFGYALTETMRYTISPPGYLPLKNTLFSLVDVPDLQVLPELWPELDSIWMGAGPVPEILHRMLIGLAWLVRIKLLPSLLPFASLFHFVINILRWGEHRGGMFVLVDGFDTNGKKIQRSWHLVAEGNDGPFIPSMAVEAIVKRSLSGKEPAAGARPATQDLELEDYESIFRTRTIYTGQREWSEDTSQQLLYQRLLGDAWKSLPRPLRDMHACKKAEGRAKVEVGKGLLSRLVQKLFGFPEAGQDIPVQVTFQAKDGGELWQRTFAGKSFSSFQSEGHGFSEKLLSEMFGIFTFGMALVVELGDQACAIRTLDSVAEIYRYKSSRFPVAGLVQQFDGHTFVDITTPGRRWLSPLIHVSHHWPGYLLTPILLLPFLFLETLIVRRTCGRGWWRTLRLLTIGGAIGFVGFYILVTTMLDPYSPLIHALFAGAGIVLYRGARKVLRR